MLGLRSVSAIAVPLLLTAALAVTASMPPAAAQRSPAGTGFSISGALDGVAATSAGNAWAVGGTGTGILILHWNGSRWT